MRVLLVIAALVVMARTASVSLDQEFDIWKQNFGKSYGSEEEESQRKMIWLDNLKLVLQHNLLADQGIKSYRLGMNRFADMSNREYQAMSKGCLGAFNGTMIESAAPYVQQTEDVDLPDAVDWRSKGYVTEVKDQMQCGSCWAFSVTGTLEGQLFKKTKKLVPLSEQQMVDCSRAFGVSACEGGWPHRALEYLIFNGGLQAESTYPYQGYEGHCLYNPQYAVTTCRGFNLHFPGDEKSLQRAVATVGPIGVAIDMSRPSFQLYQSGVYDEPDCSSNDLNHAVLAVGYGTESKKDYWLIKNSWGPHWGDKGYIKMSRNKKNQCGISSYVIYPRI